MVPFAFSPSRSETLSDRLGSENFSLLDSLELFTQKHSWLGPLPTEPQVCAQGPGLQLHTPPPPPPLQ